eukprot:9846098-Prorocentrum_lima.AAC.1
MALRESFSRRLREDDEEEVRGDVRPPCLLRPLLLPRPRPRLPFGPGVARYGTGVFSAFMQASQESRAET